MGDVTTLVHTRMTPEQCLQSCIEEDLHEAIVLGWDRDGRLFMRSSHMTREHALWMIECSKDLVINAENE